jgi:hypothetical protein
VSNLLPLAVQPPRTRAATPPEARPAEPQNDRFADSLATARGDDARPSAEEAESAKTRLAAHQRAQLQTLMLSGAMKFAVTRHTPAPESVSVPFLARSLPATPYDEVAETLPDDGTLLLISPIATPGMSEEWGTQEPEVIPVPVTLNGDAHSGQRPELGLNDVTTELPDAPAVQSDAAAARDAALQLIASLPLALATLPVPLPGAPAFPDFGASDGAAEGATDGATNGAPTGESTARPIQYLRPEGFIASLPDAPAIDDTSRLLEDHFDAPSATTTSPPSTTLTGNTGAADTTGSIRTAETTGRATDTVATTETTPRTSAVPPVIDRNAVERDLKRLDPVFRKRLERVMDRMQKEFGHDVSIVETVRSKARQDALFAQGRTAPGPVVTWTRHSKHLKGQAADLIVDGTWKNPEGYAHLAAVAKQEGLRTLGARDRGHVELPTGSSVSDQTLSALLSDLQPEDGAAVPQVRADLNPERENLSNASAMARVADVAQVARVATVAAVAKVATVARPGGASGSAASGNDIASPLAVSGAAPMAGTPNADNVRVIAPSMAVNMSDRISHLMDLQATQAAKPLTSVLLRMDNVSGIEDQIRIDTRGTSVDARLGLGNAQQAAAITGRLGELREALERRGLSAEGVRIQSPGALRAAEGPNGIRTTAPIVELAAMRAASDNQAQSNTREQATRDHEREALARDSSRHTPRSSSDDTRHRSRREQPEDRR